LPTADEVPAGLDEVDQSDLFAPAVRKRYHQDITYPSESYLDLLATYSGHRALHADQRKGLLDCIASLIDDAYAGSVTKRYLYELRVARGTLAATWS
jgi:hypothetical protein